MAFRITDTLIGAQPIANTETTAEHPWASHRTRARRSDLWGGRVHLPERRGLDGGRARGRLRPVPPHHDAGSSDGRHRPGGGAPCRRMSPASTAGIRSRRALPRCSRPNAMTSAPTCSCWRRRLAAWTTPMSRASRFVGCKVATTTGTPSSGLALITINRPVHEGQID